MDEATPSSAQRAKRLQEALSQMAHAVRTLRFNVADERRGAMLDGVLSSLRGVLAATPQVEIFVEPYRLLWQTQNVYEEQDRAESLAFRLYRDGISAVIITHELEQGELAQFVDLLIAPPQLAEQAGEDPVTRLWSAPLKAIWVCERPWFGLRLLDPACQDPLSLGALAEDSLVFLAQAGHDNHAAIQPWQSKAQLLQSWEEVAARHQPQRSSALLSQTPALAPSSLKHHAISELEELLLSAAAAPRELAPPEVLGELTLVLIKSLMSLNQPEALEHLYGTMGELLEAQPNPERVARLREALDQGTNLSALRQLLLHISHQPQTQGGYDWAPRFFSERLNAPVQECTQLFNLNLSSHAFDLLVETLWMRQGEDITFWSAIMDDLQDAGAVELLQLLSTRARVDFNIALATRSAKSPSVEVRAAALTHLPDVDEKRVRTTLIEALRDRESKVRIAALTRMGTQKEGAIGIFLVEHFQHTELLSHSQAELRALTEALLNLGGSRYANLLLNALDHLGDEIRAEHSTQSAGAEALVASRMILTSLTRLPHQSVRHRLAERLERAPASLNHDYTEALRILDERSAPVTDPSRTRPLRSRSIQRLKRPRKSRPRTPDQSPQRPSAQRAGEPDAAEAHAPPADRTSSADANLTSLLSAYLNEDSSLPSVTGWIQHSGATQPAAARSPSWMDLNPAEDFIDSILRDYLSLSGDIHSAPEAPTPLTSEDGLSQEDLAVEEALSALAHAQDTALRAHDDSEGFIPDPTDTSWMEEFDDPALNSDVADIIEDLMSHPAGSLDEEGDL